LRRKTSFGDFLGLFDKIYRAVRSVQWVSLKLENSLVSSTRQRGKVR